MSPDSFLTGIYFFVLQLIKVSRATTRLVFIQDTYQNCLSVRASERHAVSLRRQYTAFSEKGQGDVMREEHYSAT